MSGAPEGANAPRWLFWLVFGVLPVTGAVVVTWLATDFGWTTVTVVGAVLLVMVLAANRVVTTRSRNH